MGLPDEILNVGLELAMEFGRHWLQPIHERLGRRFPELDRVQLDDCDRLCREAMTFGHRLTASVLRELGGFHDDAPGLFTQRMLTAYPWVTASNAGALYSQGCYYALK